MGDGTHCTKISCRKNPLISGGGNLGEANLIPLKKAKNSRFSAAAAAVLVVIREATFLFREKQDTISEQRQRNLFVSVAKSAAVPTTRAIPADANTNLTIGDIVIIVRQ